MLWHVHTTGEVYVYEKLLCHSSLQKTTHVTHRNKFLELYASQEIECFARVIIRGVWMVKFSYQITVQLTSVYFTFGETDKTDWIIRRVEFKKDTKNVQTHRVHLTVCARF